MSLLDEPLREQARAIASRDADPAELLDEALRRIDERNPQLNAIAETFPDRSREMLGTAPDGPLRGVPVMIKDEWPLPWRAERLGAAEPIGARLEPGESGPFLALRDAGAVIVAVTTMHEYGAGTTGALSVYGPAHNPWDTERCTGGSSSGSAAAVAARLTGAAVGADGVGSVRTPSAWCGVTGLKPTFGRSAMAGHHVRNTEAIVSGPICRDAADCRLFAGTLFGEELVAGDPTGLRIGLVPGDVWDDCDPEVAGACRAAVDAVADACGGTTTELDIDGREHVLLAAVLLLQAEDFADVRPEDVAALGEDVSLLARALGRYRFLIPANAVERARRVRTIVRRSLADAFQTVDVIAWPTLAAPAPPIENPVLDLPSGHTTADLATARQVGIANLTGIPGISVPVGRSSEGLPIGLQLFGAWGRDELLLDAAEALEEANGREWVDAVPPPAT